MPNPVVLEAEGDSYTPSCRIMVVIWVGTTVSGDRVILNDYKSGKVLWEGATDTTTTYLGANFSEFNVPAEGFIVSRLDGGRLLVYLAQG